MVDVVRGTIRVRKWPKKRGKPRSEAQRFWVDWFKQANLLAKYVDAASATLAIELTKGSGWYPRDVLLKAMRGRLYWWTDQDGRKWFPMAAVGDISLTLDVLAQTVGSVLVRAVDRWRAPPAGVSGDVLTNKGPGNPPEWAPITGAAGVTQEELAGSPVVVDNTASLYDFDVTTYVTLDIKIEAIIFAAADRPMILVSTDGGLTFHSGAADYRFMQFNNLGAGGGVTGRMTWDDGAASGSWTGVMRLTDLRAGRCSYNGVVSRGSSAVKLHSGFYRSAGPITDIRIAAFSGNNMVTGTIQLTGLVSA